MQSLSDNSFLAKLKAWRFKKVHKNSRYKSYNSTAHEDERERTPYYTCDLD
jgi:hypothetical protein